MTIEETVWLIVKFLALVIVGLRLSWLLIEDKITRGPRNSVIVWAKKRGWEQLAFAMECPFCVGLWVQTFVVAVLCLGGFASLPLPLLWPLAVNMLAAPLHHKLDKALV